MIIIVIITIKMIVAKKGNPWERNWVSSDSSPKQRYNEDVIAKTVKTQQNSRCILSGDRDKTINPIKSECNYLAQKEYKTRHDKWYMHNQESVLENETHKLLWDFEIQTDHLISARLPDLVIVKKNWEPAE